MSRVGRSPIAVPAGVTVQVTSERVEVSGPKGTLSRTVPGGITVDASGDTVVVSRASDEREHRSLHGLTRTLIANMVAGVTEGWSKELEIQGVGYRCAAKGPSQLELALGFSHPVVYNAPEGVTFDVPAPTRIIVRGSDKEAVGQVAASLRRLRPPEPYKGKGVRYANEKVLRKAGKAAK